MKARLRTQSIVHFHLGNREASDQALAEFIARFGDGAGFTVANMYAQRGEIDLAFKWMYRG
jgi:hypothetical protein